MSTELTIKEFSQKLQSEQESKLWTSLRQVTKVTKAERVREIYRESRDIEQTNNYIW